MVLFQESLSIPAEVIENLVKLMPCRLAAVNRSNTVVSYLWEQLWFALNCFFGTWSLTIES